MGACNGADAIECVAHIGHPIAQRVIHRVFQGAAAAGHGHNLGPQQFHAEHIGRLTLDIMGAHIDHAFQPEFRADSRRGNAVLASTCFRDDAGLAHATRQNDLAQDIVDLMRACMVQLVALHVDFRAAKPLGQTLGMIERRRAAHIMLPQEIHLIPEALVCFGKLVLFFQLKDQRHQGFRHKPPAEIAEAAAFIRACHIAVQDVIGHRLRLLCAVQSA